MEKVHQDFQSYQQTGEGQQCQVLSTRGSSRPSTYRLLPASQSPTPLYNRALSNPTQSRPNDRHVAVEPDTPIRPTSGADRRALSLRHSHAAPPSVHRSVYETARPGVHRLVYQTAHRLAV